MYSAPGTTPSSFAGTAAAVYGNAYSPYDYLKHGSYSYWTNPGLTMPYADRGLTPAYGYVQPYYGPTYYSSPAYSATPPVAQNSNTASIAVRVPQNAEIWFEGDKTTQTGTVRNFVSPSLEPGKSYTYSVRARWTDAEGKVVDRTQEVKVQAGRQSDLNFASGTTVVGR
jgi:uncharacterized protein (TIGR03000 family)